MLDILEAMIKMGIPLMLMSWWAFSALYRANLIDKSADRKRTEKAVASYRKELKAAEKAKKKALKSSAFKSSSVDDDHLDQFDPSNTDFWITKWMRFGGGFYGLAALWTLLVLEAQELWQFAWSLPTFITDFSGGLIDLLVMFLQNQIMNIVTALSWIVKWTEGFSLTLLIVAYLGYSGGIQLAKRWDAKEQVQNFVKR